MLLLLLEWLKLVVEVTQCSNLISKGKKEMTKILTKTGRNRAEDHTTAQRRVGVSLAIKSLMRRGLKLLYVEIPGREVEKWPMSVCISDSLVSGDMAELSSGDAG